MLVDALRVYGFPPFFRLSLMSAPTKDRSLPRLKGSIGELACEIFFPFLFPSLRICFPEDPSLQKLEEDRFWHVHGSGFPRRPILRRMTEVSQNWTTSSSRGFLGVFPDSGHSGPHSLKHTLPGTPPSHINCENRQDW